MDFLDKVSNFFDDIFLDDRRNATESDKVALERARVQNSLALSNAQLKAERERNLFKIIQIGILLIGLYAIYSIVKK